MINDKPSTSPTPKLPPQLKPAPLQVLVFPKRLLLNKVSQEFLTLALRDKEAHLNIALTVDLKDINS